MHRWRMMAILVALLLALPAQAQTTGIAPANGIGLTPDHKRIIYREVAAERASPAGGDPIAIGERIPDSMTLVEMPVAVKDRIGLLRDFKFAKLGNDSILIVDPAQRRVVDMVTKEEGAAE